MYERRPEQPQRRDLLLPRLIRTIFHRTRGQAPEQPIMIREHVAAISQQEEPTTTPNNLSDINKRRRESHLKHAITQLGETLGRAFHDYSFNRFGPSQETYPRRFAEVIATAMETGTHEDKVNAITALLRAVDEGDAFVRNEAGDNVDNIWQHMPDRDRLSSH